MNKENILKILKELRSEKQRKFAQTVDLIVNLRNFNIKKDSVSVVVNIPHKVRDKKVCAFLTQKSEFVDSITKPEFNKYKGRELKKLSKKYDYFIAIGNLMPAVATSFGRVLGPLGKMPSPQLGILRSEDEKSIKEILERINNSVKIKSKEPSIKIAVGKENLKDEEIAENVLAVYNAILDNLPRKKENLKSVMIKLTMTKPRKIEIK